ncbi:MAG: carbon-nitrogen hydrolase [Helicobacteraceae bacterium]|jgi:N-carbamoylputrescine amidase|nr:carbon-nitrogen hydrolase [Helicobacteraceae bacterium]
MIVNAALIQKKIGDSPDENRKRLSEAIRSAARDKADLIVLSELHNTRYFCQSEDAACFDLAETVPGESTAFFGRLAQEQKVVLVISLFEKRAAGLYHNTAVVIEKDGNIAGKYRKMHIPDDPAFYEKFYFTPGDLGFEPIKTSVGKLGVLICWDQWYPEAARLMALKGADMLIYPTAIGWDPNDGEDEKKRQLQAWEIAQRAHAVSNALPVLSVNRVGFEEGGHGGIEFWGGSFIAGAQGEILAKADREEATVFAAIDTEKTEKLRRIWPFMRDRRIESYGDLTKRWGE